MILYRAGASFRIDAQAARHLGMRAQFARERGTEPDRAPGAAGSEPETLVFRRWWAERQPEARWASTHASGAFVIDVSHGHWRNGAFLLTFDVPVDAQRFALTFLGRDQAECEAVMREQTGTQAGSASRIPTGT